MTTVPRIMILVSALACGCGGEDAANQDAGANTGDGGPQVSCNVQVSCPASPQAIGGAGSYATNTINVTWKYCAESQVSYADPVYVSLPVDLTGLTVVAEHGETKTGFIEVRLDGDVLINPSLFGKGPFGHAPLTNPASTFTMPMDADTFPAGDCLAVVPIAAGDVSGQTGRIHFVSRKGDPTTELLDLNIVVVDGVNISNAEIDQAIDVMDQLYGVPAVGNVTFTTTSIVNPMIEFAGADVNRLRALDLPGDGRAMNIFFIADVLGASGTLGWAAGIPGPNGVKGTAGSGVIIAVDSHRQAGGQLDVTTMGETLAHETGHQLGLLHTTESNGMTHDFLSDTPECPASNDVNGDMKVTADECVGKGGDYMMFWIAGIPQTQISPLQSDVIYFSPLTR